MTSLHHSPQSPLGCVSVSVRESEGAREYVYVHVCTSVCTGVGMCVSVLTSMVIPVMVVPTVCTYK